MGEKYHKLVRDKIPEMLNGKGISYEKEIAIGSELKDWFIKKLDEEYQEFKEDLSVEELADLLEVIRGLEKLPEYADLEKVRAEKAEKRGGFQEGIILKGEK